MSEENKTEQNQNKTQPAADEPKKEDVGKNRGTRGVVIVVLAIVLTVSGIIGYNYWQGRRLDNGTGNEQKLALPITRAQVEKDFVNNKEKKTQAETVPPANFKERYLGFINSSLQAIESGQPSQPEFKDLLEDYFNVAVSYGILGEYAKAEEYYFKLLEKWPGDYKTMLNLGDLYILMDQPLSAAVIFFETMEHYPDDYRVYGKLAELYVNYALGENKLTTADALYQAGTENAVYKRALYKEYAFFLENYMYDYKRALMAEREYQKITGSVEQQEIDRLEKMIGE